MTEIRQWWKPTELPPQIQSSMEAMGPFLGRGYTYPEIASQFDPPRSADWVASRLREARAAIAEQVLENAGDKLPAELRARLEAYVTR